MQFGSLDHSSQHLRPTKKSVSKSIVNSPYVKRSGLFSDSNNLSCYRKPAYDLSAQKHTNPNFDLLSTQSKRAGSELNYNLHRKFENGGKFLLLDQEKMGKLALAENLNDKSLFEPEGYHSDHKLAYQQYASLSTRSRQKALREADPMGSGAAQETLRKALSYRFRLQDLHKYSQRLKYRDCDWKLKLSALGKVIPDVRQRKKILIKASHLNTLFRLLKSTDWSQTPVYYQFLRNGRWKHEDDNIYSEIELQYNISYINKLITGANKEQIQLETATEINEKYLAKTMQTLQVLMNQMNMMYFWEKLRLEYGDQDVLDLFTLSKLQSRCVKLYKMIDQFVDVFKLISKREVSITLYGGFNICLFFIATRNKGRTRRDFERTQQDSDQPAVLGEPRAAQLVHLQRQSRLELMTG